MFNDSRVTYAGLLQLRSLKALEEVSTSPAWLLADQVDTMRDLWPNFEGNWLTSDGLCFLWDLEAETLKATVGIVPDYSSEPVFSPDGSQAVQSLRGRLYSLDATKGTVLRQLANVVSRRPCHHPVAFSGDGKCVAAREAANPRERKGSLKVWEAATGELLFERATPDEGSDAKWPPNVLALSAGGRFLATGRCSPSVRVWNVSDKTLRAEVPASDVRQLAFLSDGKRLLVGTVPDLHVWDLAEKVEILKIPRVASFVLSKDEKTVVTHDGRAAVHIYDPADGRLLRSYEGDWPLTPQAILSPDGRFLVTTDNFGVLSIWNIASGKLDHQVKPTDCHAMGDLAAGQFTPDGKYLIVLSGMTPPPE
jgi:WD40 repeat protein